MYRRVTGQYRRKEVIIMQCLLMDSIDCQTKRNKINKQYKGENNWSREARKPHRPQEGQGVPTSWHKTMGSLSFTDEPTKA